MFDPKTLYLTCGAMMAMMTLLCFLTWRTNKSIPGTATYTLYPLALFLATMSFSLNNYLEYWQTIGIGNALFFGASIIHVVAISQFLNHKGWELKSFLVFTCGLLFAFAYFSIVEDNLRMRVFISGLQHIAEIVLLLSLFWRFARPLYPNGTIVYTIVLVMLLIAFVGRSILMGDVTRATISLDIWFSSTVFINGVISPIFYVTGMALLCNERRELHLNQLTEKAQKDLEIRGLFLSTISHEIRTPLNGILGSAQLVLGQTKSNKNKAYCEAIINSAESLNLLIDKVLDYASLEQSNESLYEEDIELKSWLNNLCLLLSPLAEQKQLSFELHYDLPDQACYYCDQQKLRQIIINLVGNAIKFTDSGSVTIKVYLAQDSAMMHTVTFSVIDSGPGIEEEDISKLTQPYVQSNAGKVKGGTGLGLAITARLLERLGSKLEIASQMGKGSIFSFTLNLPIGELSLVTQRQHEQNCVTGLNILLVEDLELNQKIAIEFMADDEHIVKLATTGHAALELLKYHQFDAVLLDMNLPDLTGQEVLKSLKKIEHKNQRTPFLAFTASLSPNEIKEYMALGIKDIVAKPIKQEKLRQALSDSQTLKETNISVELADVLYDETAALSLLKNFNDDEVSSIYNEFVLSARNKLISIQQQLDIDNEQCIKQLHRQASTALQLGFNRYGTALKHIERRLLEQKTAQDELTQAMVLWQSSLNAYLKFVRSQNMK